MNKSEQMSRVRSRNTMPEKIVRRLLSQAGVRYRLHRSDLPGRPDLYVGRLRLAIFVNGCFWHGHTCARGGRPKKNSRFWNEKINRNVVRDLAARTALRRMGVRSIVLWTCKLRAFPVMCRAVARAYQKVQR